MIDRRTATVHGGPDVPQPAVVAVTVATAMVGDAPLAGVRALLRNRRRLGVQVLLHGSTEWTAAPVQPTQKFLPKVCGQLEDLAQGSAVDVADDGSCGQYMALYQKMRKADMLEA